ncbi:MAG TPA: XTP/dITP diphosphatase [Patescibacteria group bacterium]|nr:XTP/dITP diphosphatase [Patescibacteria group bacterium]
MMELVVATRNPGKVKEIEHKLAALPVRVLSLADCGHSGEAPETETTFAANAEQKARYYLAVTGRACLADDSGLEVDALRGAPGVYSARYAGENASDADNNRKLLAALADVPAAKRTARFRCSLALITPDGKTFRADGAVEGLILDKTRGTGGFGYDPLFFLPELDKTMAELSADEKNRISHRGRALDELATVLAGEMRCGLA